ncbi:MAG TPA: Hsp20/alpha crystallin family protein [Methylomirabilota bacterium]|jgi:HSP20 family protein|nr:Hsp20/alpha crystallin family protein [Methylomirabilota bacterium]
MNALTPWTGMRRELERFFDRLPEPLFEAFESSGAWMPKLDVSETRDAMMVKAELPGVEQDDITVSLQGDLLTLKGEKTLEKEAKDEQFHRMERSYGAFLRTVRLPSMVDATNVTAQFAKGVLTVTLPKSATAKGTTIPVKTV